MPLRGVQMKKVDIYTDGACSYNPGPGGWAAILLYADMRKELSGGEKNTTNNRMELTAVIKALEALKEICTVNLFTDSAYIVNAFVQGWLDKWQQNGWLTAGKKPVENKDLWFTLLGLTREHNVNFIKVKGHADNALNNACDKLARMEITKIVSPKGDE